MLHAYRLISHILMATITSAEDYITLPLTGFAISEGRGYGMSQF